MILILILALDTLKLDLNQTIEIGLKKSLEINESRQAVNLSRVGSYDALADLLPTPKSYYEYRNSEGFFDTTSYSWNLTLSQTIFNTSIIYSIINSYDQLSLAKTGLKEMIARKVYEITESYINLIVSFAADKTLDFALKRAIENHRLAKARNELGLSSKLDLLQAEIAMINAEKALLDNRYQIEQEEERLSNLLDTSSYIIPTDTLTVPLIKPNLLNLEEELLENNPLVKSARIELSDARKQLIASYFALLPSVSGFLTYSYDSFDKPASIREIWDEKYRSYGIRIDLPFFNIKDIILGIATSKIKKKQAELRLRIKTKEQQENLSVATRALKSSLAEIELNKKSLEAASEAMRLAQERYKAGIGNLLTLLTAQSDLERSEVNYLKGLGAYHKSLAQISYLIGKGAE